VRIFLLLFAIVYILQLFPSVRGWLFEFAPSLYGRAGIAFYGAAMLFGVFGTLWVIRRLLSSPDLSFAKGWPLLIVPIATAGAFLIGDFATRGGPASAVAIPSPSEAGGFLHAELPIHGYGFMIMLGFLSALTILAQRAKSVGYDANIALDIGIIAMIGGIIGSRIAYIWTQPDQFIQTSETGVPIEPHQWDLVKMLAIWNGGLVFYGGLILGGIGVMLFIRHLRLPLGLWTDMIAPTIPLAIGFARLGCFLNGCCFGVESTPGYPGFTYPPGNAPIHEINRVLRENGDAAIHYSTTTQMYESFACFFLFFLTTWYFRRRRNFGTVLPFFAVFYGVFRFFIENYRADNLAPNDKGELTTLMNITLTFSQWTSILLVSIGVISWIAVTLTALKRRERMASGGGGGNPPAAAAGTA
jgi:phosphatidylglycerol:prolipoprotein diacylglycerol transferase